jgi:hypothetical protein
MIPAHIMGLPIEESALQLAPAGAAMVTLVAIGGRAGLGRLRRWLRHHQYRFARAFARTGRGENP